MTKVASAGFKRVLEIRSAKFGRDHPLVAEAVARCGRAVVASGRREEVTVQQERGYRLLAKRFGTSIPAEYRWVAEAYANLLRGANREEEAKRVLSAVAKSTLLR